MTGAVEITPYQAGYRADVLHIAADSAFFGEPVEAFLEDRRLFCDASIGYYADFEAEYLWLALEDTRLVGYLAGCVDTPAQRRRYLTKSIAPLIGRVLLGRYRLGEKTWRTARSMFAGLLRSELAHVNYDEYPAHLHVNVAVDSRGKGIGKRLIETYLRQLRELQVPGVFLGTTNLNKAACRLYEKIGFTLLDAKITSIWNSFVDGDVENRSYGLRLMNP